jgi:hypothetical protein
MLMEVVLHVLAGVATQLFTQVINSARIARATHIFLHVLEGNQPALAFYKKQVLGTGGYPSALAALGGVLRSPALCMIMLLLSQQGAVLQRSLVPRLPPSSPCRASLLLAQCPGTTPCQAPSPVR